MEETNENIAIDTPANANEGETLVNTILIEEKLDTIIALETQQTSTSLVSVGLLVASVVIFLLYKFISNFFEF